MNSYWFLGGDSPGDDTGGQHTNSNKESTSPKQSAKNNSSHNNRSNPPPPSNSHATPHLLDAPLQGATCQQVPDQTPALVILESKSQSPKNASIGVSNLCYFRSTFSYSPIPTIVFQRKNLGEFCQKLSLLFFRIFISLEILVWESLSITTAS